VRVVVAPAAFERLAYGDRRHGMVAVAKQFSLGLERLPEDAKRVCVYVGVEKPGNVGALLRTADGAGIDGVILSDPRTDVFNPNVVRASAGALFSARLAAVSAVEALAWLRERSLKVFAARVGVASDYREVDWSRPCAIVLGSEAEGLDAVWQGEGISPISLPMRGRVDSLNVSVTAGILLYEMMRAQK
jgi:TrmH family RNA methyltransferase